MSVDFGGINTIALFIWFSSYDDSQARDIGLFHYNNNNKKNKDFGYGLPIYFGYIIIDPLFIDIINYTLKVSKKIVLYIRDTSIDRVQFALL